ncbi:MAG: AAA family ATPase [bacterium]
MRIALCGPAGAGKTTLFEELKSHLDDYIFYPEIANTLINFEPALFYDKKAFEEKLIEIHRLREHRDDKENNTVFDRCIWDCYVYSDYYGYPYDKQIAISETLKSYIDAIFVLPQITQPVDLHLKGIYIKYAQDLAYFGQSVHFLEFTKTSVQINYILDTINTFKSRNYSNVSFS